MPENFDRLDTDGAPGSGEQAGESDEAFRDRYRKAQAAIKKVRQQEGKKKKDDNMLARIIVQFLHDPRFTRFFLLISRIVAKNVPSDIILAILALIHQESAYAINEKYQEKLLQLSGKISTAENDDETDTVLKEGALTPETKVEISTWTKNIAIVAAAEPHQALETIMDQDWNMDQNIPELASSVLQQFFVFQNIEIPPIENLRSFANSFFQKLIEELENQVHNQGALTGETDSDFNE